MSAGPPVVVDTSVWIDFFSPRPGPAGDELRRMIAAAEPVIVTGIIVTEILQGLVRDVASGRAEYAVLVGEPWQGRGLGNLLTGYCLKHLDHGQIHEVYAITGRTNVRMIRVFQRYGFDLGPAPDPTLLLATKQVS